MKLRNDMNAKDELIALEIADLKERLDKQQALVDKLAECLLCAIKHMVKEDKMKLRNKKTEKVFDVIVREKSNGNGEYSIIIFNLRAIRSARSVSSILGEYDSLANLCEEWEDVKEPLIKADKIQEFLKMVEELKCSNKHLEERLKNLNETIAELCGDEE